MAEPLLRPRVDLADDPFRYGWRIGTDLGYVPLAPDDFLDPQPGDQMVQGDTHAWLVFDLADRLKRRYESSPDIAVFTDLKMIWGIPGLSEPAPDVAVVKGIRDKDEERSSFYASREGIVPTLVVEVVSPVHPALRSRDLRHKVEIYQQAGVLHQAELREAEAMAEIARLRAEIEQLRGPR